MFIFKYEDLFFQNVHPIASISYILSLFIIVMASNHPLLLCYVAMIIFLSSIATNGIEDIKMGLGFIFRMFIFLLIINTFLDKNGRTVILYGPILPILGRLQISLESLVYTLTMGIRLFSIYMLFIFYNKAISPDALLSYLAIVFPNSTLLISITTKTIPHLAQLSQRVEQILTVMGLQTDRMGFIGKVKARLPVIKIVFMSSIEDSLSMAESIQARGYGTGKRSRYSKYNWNVSDIAILMLSIWSIIGFIILVSSGGISYNFYPILAKLSRSIQKIGLFISIIITLAIPAVVGWGRQYWKYIV